MNEQEKIDVVKEIEALLNDASKASGLTTGEVRNISAQCFKRIEDKSIDNVLKICEKLLEKKKWELGVVAYDWAFRMKKQYSEQTFYIFEQWLKKYVTGWGDCDDFCTHAFGEFMIQYPHMFRHVLQWTEHPDFWVRRAAAVILIYPIKKGKLQSVNPFAICDKLLQDEHHLVLKGYGWMLKVLSCYKPEEVTDYLMKNIAVMPRVSFRYAIEKFDKHKKAMLMA